jgi:hypothetical protein
MPWLTSDQEYEIITTGSLDEFNRALRQYSRLRKNLSQQENINDHRKYLNMQANYYSRHGGKRHGTRRGGSLGPRRYGGSKRNCRRTRRGGDWNFPPASDIWWR